MSFISHPSVFVVQAAHLSSDSRGVGLGFFRKLKAAERVHYFEGSWDNASTRLGQKSGLGQRREIYALGDVHDAYFSIQVAYTSGVCDSLDAVILGKDKVPCGHKPDTALFYSVSAWPDAPKGGARDFIHKVAVKIAEARPEIDTYSTLSPLTGFKAWVETGLTQEFINTHDTHKVIARPVPDIRMAIKESIAEVGGQFIVRKRLVAACGSIDSDVARLAALYMVHGNNVVTRLHHGNSASLYRLCIGANQSRRGRDDSFGLMANYLYKRGSSLAPFEIVQKPNGLPHSSLLANFIAGGAYSLT